MRPTASRRSVRTIPAGANVVAVGIVAAAAAIVGACRSSADGSRADRRRTDSVTPIPVAAITIAPATHCNSTTPRSSNCDSAAPVASGCNSAAAVSTSVISATAPIAPTAATAGIGIVWDQTGGEQNKCCGSSENIAKHDSNLSTKSGSTGDCGGLDALG